MKVLSGTPGRLGAESDKLSIFTMNKLSVCGCRRRGYICYMNKILVAAYLVIPIALLNKLGKSGINFLQFPLKNNIFCNENSCLLWLMSMGELFTNGCTIKTCKT